MYIYIYIYRFLVDHVSEARVQKITEELSIINKQIAKIKLGNNCIVHYDRFREARGNVFEVIPVCRRCCSFSTQYQKIPKDGKL